MCFVKLVNEETHVNYSTPMALYNLLRYVFLPEKTILDSVRPIYCYRDLSGCEPFLFPHEYEHDPDAIYNWMLLYSSAYRTNDNNLAKQRIISFHCSDYVIPSDMDELGRLICCTYSKFGYIAAYSVHQDTYHCHVHIIVCTTSYVDGHRFHIKDELSMLYEICGSWYELHSKLLENDPKLKEFYENALFGDDLHRVDIPLTAHEQIRQNNRLRKSNRYMCS